MVIVVKLIGGNAHREHLFSGIDRWKNGGGLIRIDSGALIDIGVRIDIIAGL